LFFGYGTGWPAEKLPRLLRLFFSSFLPHLSFHLGFVCYNVLGGPLFRLDFASFSFCRFNSLVILLWPQDILSLPSSSPCTVTFLSLHESEKQRLSFPSSKWIVIPLHHISLRPGKAPRYSSFFVPFPFLPWYVLFADYSTAPLFLLSFLPLLFLPLGFFSLWKPSALKTPSLPS